MRRRQARSTGRRRSGGGGSGAHGNAGSERWLLTYSDLITLLMALFMVLFAISSVNHSKFVILQHALHDAFSGKVLPGGASIASSGADPSTATPAPQPPFPPISPDIQGPSAETTRVSAQDADATSALVQRQAQAIRAEDLEFEHLKRLVEAYAREHGFEHQIHATITPRGLRIRLLTDKVVFDSGYAVIKPQGRVLLARIARLLKLETRNPIQVDGHTDPVPIAGGPYHSNWELSTARATSVVQFFIEQGVAPQRLGAGGYAWYQPVDSNETAAGRARNRRVDILLERLHQRVIAVRSPEGTR